MIASLVQIPGGINSVVSVFISAQTDYRCKTCFDEFVNQNNTNYDLYESNLTTTFYGTKKTNDMCDSGLDRCSVSNQVIYGGNFSDYQPVEECCYPDSDVSRSCDSNEILDTDKYDYTTYSTCEEYVYDTSYYKSTTISEFNLVCGNSWIADLSTSFYYLGFGFGGVISGICSDKYGRKPVMIICTILLMACDIYTAFVPNVYIFSLMRFLNGFFVNAIIVPGYILAMEYIGSSKRAMMTSFFQALFAVGIMLLSFPFANYLREWRDLHLWISVSCLPTILLAPFLLPKSYKFLISQQKGDEAAEIAIKMMQKNKSKICGNDYEISKEEEKELRENINQQIDGLRKEEGSQQKSKATLIDVFKDPNMRLITLNLMFNWFTNSMVYYGLSLNAGSLPGTDVFNNFINGIIEIPAYIIFPFFLSWSKTGRTGTLGWFMILGGLCCLGSTLFLEFRKTCDDSDKFALAGQILAYLGKFCYAGTFSVDYNYSAEIFPAEIRSAGLAICSVGARISGVISPFVLSLSSVYTWLPGAIFAVLAIAAGSATFLLPETLGKPLLSTLEETNEVYFSKKTKKSTEKGIENQAIDQIE